MKYLKDEAVETIRDQTKDKFYSAEDIQWVLTVPAIWTAAAKQFMREAAYQVTKIILIVCYIFVSITFKRISTNFEWCWGALGGFDRLKGRSILTGKPTDNVRFFVRLKFDYHKWLSRNRQVR